MTMGEVLDKANALTGHPVSVFNLRNEADRLKARQIVCDAIAAGLAAYPPPAPTAPAMRDKCLRTGRKWGRAGKHHKAHKARIVHYPPHCSFCGKTGHNAKCCPNRQS